MTTTTTKRRKATAAADAIGTQVTDDAIETSADVLRQRREADRLREQHARLYRDLIQRMSDDTATDDDIAAAGALAERHGWDVVRDMKLLIEVRATHRKYADGFDVVLAAANEKSKLAAAELEKAIQEKQALESRINELKGKCLQELGRIQTAIASRNRMAAIASGFPHLFGE